jgi:transposase
MRLLLSQRRNLKRKYLDIENTIRHSLKAFGIRLGGTSRGAFDRAVREAVAGDKLTSELMDAMLSARAALWKEYCGCIIWSSSSSLAISSAGVSWRFLGSVR